LQRTAATVSPPVFALSVSWERSRDCRAKRVLLDDIRFDPICAARISGQRGERMLSLKPSMTIVFALRCDAEADVKRGQYQQAFRQAEADDR
jgi:hypothetical protein